MNAYSTSTDWARIPHDHRNACLLPWASSSILARTTLNIIRPLKYRREYSSSASSATVSAFGVRLLARPRTGGATARAERV
eukprot:scaffold101511_cov51-Phaeocystis_antarctica.AAC.2